MPEGREALDKQIEERAAAVDQYLAINFKLTQLMEAQGRDTSAWFEFLDGHIIRQAAPSITIPCFL